MVYCHNRRDYPRCRTLWSLGGGQLSAEIKSLASSLELNNVTFVDWVDYDGLLEEYLRSDLCLGIFSQTEKCGRAIPNKVFDALAAERAVITGDTGATRELLSDRQDALLCRVGDPMFLRGGIAAGGLRLHQNKLRSLVIGEDIRSKLE